MGQIGSIFRYEITIPVGAVDQNGHANNVIYVQWMQDAAMRQFEHIGGVLPMRAAGGTWVVHSHKIEYLSPAFSGERIEVRTWVAGIRRVRSVRRYEFVRILDSKLLVRGETDWVFVDSKSGRPIAIPEAVLRIFPVVPDDKTENR
jgi:acyl-CoA thioester hydrolase